MKRPLQIGITGGIGTGKSLVCQIFQCLGVKVYDADSRAKELMATDPILVDQIRKEFGSQAYLPDGGIDRSYLAQTVFGNSQQLERLNQLVHPRVREDYAFWVSQRLSDPYVIKEADLIFEAGSWKELDKIIVVSAPEALRMKRVQQRDPGRTEEEILNIFQSQLPDEEKLKRADF